MIIKAIIVDDEALGIKSLKWDLERLEHPIEIVETFTDPIAALAYLNSEKIDLLFLDIQMPELTGFELLAKVKDINFSVIFVTSYDEFALKAFRYSALDYLLKPVDQDELKAAMQKYTEQLETKATKDVSSQLQIHAFASEGNLPDKLAFSTKETVEFLRPDEMMYCEAVSNYSNIYMSSGKLLVCKTLRELEEMLKDYRFIRVHRSFLINPAFIKRYIKTLGGSIIMENGFEISISRTKKEEVSRWLFNK